MRAPRDTTEGSGVSVGKEESGAIPSGEQLAPFPASFLMTPTSGVLVSQDKAGLTSHLDLLSECHRESSHMPLPLAKVGSDACCLSGAALPAHGSPMATPKQIRSLELGPPCIAQAGTVSFLSLLSAEIMVPPRTGYSAFRSERTHPRVGAAKPGLGPGSLPRSLCTPTCRTLSA